MKNEKDVGAEDISIEPNGPIDISEFDELYIQVDRKDFMKILHKRPCKYGATYEYAGEQAVVTGKLTATYKPSCAAERIDDKIIKNHVEHFEHLP